MRQSMFGDFFVTDANEDILDVLVAREVELDDCFADVEEDGEGGYAVAIRDNETGEEVLQTDTGLFADVGAARSWAAKWVSDVNINV